MAFKCLVLNCGNRSDQGTMIGPLCVPCHDMLTTGTPRMGDDWVSRLARRNKFLCDKLRVIEKAVHDGLSGAA